jgi:hypothetical protein
METAVHPKSPSANDNDEAELQRAWRDHCLYMAHATEALAHWCGNEAMMKAYLDLAAEWTRQAASDS